MHATLVGLTALLLSASTALAQTTPTTPSPAPDAATGGIADYWSSSVSSRASLGSRRGTHERKSP